jgi:hypothetical protein
MKGYPVDAEQVSESGGIVSWVVSDTDTGVVGLGSATVYITSGDVIAKTISYGTRILYADAIGPDPPDPFADWTTIIIEMAQAATEAAQAAIAAAASVTPSTDEDVAYIMGVI